VNVDLRPEFDLAQFPVFLFLARVFVFLRLFVLESTVIADSTDRRHRGGRDFNEVEALGARHVERFLGGHDAELSSLIVDHPHRADPDLVVDA
jgi:hypothetical protein